MYSMDSDSHPIIDKKEKLPKWTVREKTVSSANDAEKLGIYIENKIKSLSVTLYKNHLQMDWELQQKTWNSETARRQSSEYTLK